MNTLESKFNTMTDLEAYNEAKNVCEHYHNYKGDKRKATYKALDRANILFMLRLDNFAKKLRLPNYLEIFHNN